VFQVAPFFQIFLPEHSNSVLISAKCMVSFRISGITFSSSDVGQTQVDAASSRDATVALAVHRHQLRGSGVLILMF
jgi:hypothetical protein